MLRGGLQAKEFFFSLFTEESCRVCKRPLSVGSWLLNMQASAGLEAKPALLHEWNALPCYSNVLCQQCWDELLEAVPIIGFCGAKEEYSFAVVSGASYKGDVRKLIHRLKYEGDRMVVKDLATIMLFGWRMAAIFLDRQNAILVPVPLHWRKTIKRGFNQSDLIAREAGKTLKIPVCKNALRRSRSTIEQQKLERPERFANVASAFRGNPRKLKDKVVVLIDDVCTSGATLSACAREATRCGATKVVALTVARTVLRKELNADATIISTELS